MQGQQLCGKYWENTLALGKLWVRKYLLFSYVKVPLILSGQQWNKRDMCNWDYSTHYLPWLFVLLGAIATFEIVPLSSACSGACVCNDLKAVCRCSKPYQTCWCEIFPLTTKQSKACLKGTQITKVLSSSVQNGGDTIAVAFRATIVHQQST